MNSKVVLSTLLTLSCVGAEAKTNAKIKSVKKPNIIIVFCDDMGYGDLSCYGNPSIATPNIDRMAAEGQKWTSFYVSASVSSPSRGGLLCGQYGVRTGLYGDVGRVLQTPHIGGIQPEQMTIAEYLKQAGYTTACVGKWHVGHQEEMLPLNHGFDYYYGIPYSNNMSVKENKAKGKVKKNAIELPFYIHTPTSKDVEIEPDQDQFTKRLSEYSLDFIKEHRKEPFFLYLAHPMPHVPLHASDEFRNRSKRGLYGDAVEEIDYNVGKMLDYLRESKLDENTIVIFSSDNGAWLDRDTQGGTAMPFREGKGTMFEGGFRVPGIFWGAGVKPALITDMGSTLDLLPTLCSMAGVPLLEDRVYDGFDLTKVLSGEKDVERDTFYYYRGSSLHAIRKGAYKLHILHTPYSSREDVPDSPLPWLFNVEVDAAELHNIAKQNPKIVAELTELAKEHLDSYEKVPSQFDRRAPNNNAANKAKK